MSLERILVLGGTGQGRKAAWALAGAGHDVVLSLAGVTARPRLPDGVAVRRGGFEGANGLASWLRSHDVSLVVDATHPFAVRMSVNVRDAAAAAAVRLVRLERPPWRPGRGDVWLSVASLEKAAEIPPHGARVFAALGSRGLEALTHRGDLWLIARMIEAPGFAIPSRWRVIRARPPACAARELALLQAIRAGWLVCRNAGGRIGRAKLEAARLLGLPVVMVERPRLPDVEVAASVEELIEGLK